MPLFSWPEMHGAIVHFPIALILAACFYELIGILLRKPVYRTVSFWMLLSAVVMSLPSLVTGWMTGTEMYRGPAPDVFLTHRNIAFLSTGLALILLAWRALARDGLVGRPLLGSLLLSLLIAAGTGYTGFLGGQMMFTRRGFTIEQTAAAPAGGNAPAGKAGLVKVVVLDSTLIEAGKKLYAREACANCHAIKGQGGNLGPPLDHTGRQHPDLTWQAEHIKEPVKFVKNSTMPPYPHLTPEELKSMATYMVSLQ